MTQEDTKSTGRASLAYETASTAPCRDSATHCHHVMEQWKGENPREEPFSSVVYYAKIDGYNLEAGVIEGGQQQNGT